MNVPNLKLESNGLFHDKKRHHKGKKHTKRFGDTDDALSIRRRLQPFGPNIWYCDGPDVANVNHFVSFTYPTRMVVIRILRQRQAHHTKQQRQHHPRTLQELNQKTVDDDKDNEECSDTEEGEEEDDNENDDDDDSEYCAWIWSPIELKENDELGREVEETVGGPISYIVSPNKYHYKFIKQWQDRYPKAKIYASPGLVQRNVVNKVKFYTTLTDQPDKCYSNDIDQIIFRCGSSTWGGGGFDEAVFFHKQSKTVLFADLVQRFPPHRLKGIKGWMLEMDGLSGTSGGTPKEIRFLIWAKNQMIETRQTLNTILYAWQPEQFIIAHGLNYSPPVPPHPSNDDDSNDYESHAIEILAHSFRWVPDNPTATCTMNCCACCYSSTDGTEQENTVQRDMVKNGKKKSTNNPNNASTCDDEKHPLL